MARTPWKVGELARAAGVPVRAVHHYDHIGLLPPSGRTRSGHRLYGAEELRRLKRIRSLRRLGFGLDDIRGLLDTPQLSADALRGHADRLRQQAEALLALCGELHRLADHADAATVDAGPQLWAALEVLSAMDQTISEDIRAKLAARADAVGADRIREVEAAWPELIAHVADLIARGVPAADPAARDAARRWNALAAEFHGGDPALANVARQYWENHAAQPRAAAAPASGGEAFVGPTPAMMAYIGAASAAG